MKQVFQMMMGFIITLVTYLFGGMDTALYTLIIVIALDTITGLSKAYIQGKLNSKVGMKGFIKKIAFLCLIATAVIIDKLCDSGGVIRNFAIYYFTVNECLSILENCVAMKLPVPKFLTQKLEQLEEEQSSK